MRTLYHFELIYLTSTVQISTNTQHRFCDTKVLKVVLENFSLVTERVAMGD